MRLAGSSGDGTLLNRREISTKSMKRPGVGIRYLCEQKIAELCARKCRLELIGDEIFTMPQQVARRMPSASQ